MAAGADFIRTSTGKVTPAATLLVTLVMLEAIRDFERATGRAPWPASPDADFAVIPPPAAVSSSSASAWTW